MKIGNHLVGDGRPCYVIAEIGINHNGDVELAKKMISLAVASGCDAVKFQKRTPEVAVPREQWDIPRETPWGLIRYIDYKHRIEFNREQYQAIDAYCAQVRIPWFASCWDEEAVDAIESFQPPCYKIASASLTDDALLRYTRSKGRPIILSTGMSTLEEIDHAVEVLGTRDLILLHCTSTYPANYDELNLKAMASLRDRYRVPVGYSGHESGLATSIAAVALGACVLERHITLDRAMWGTDQAASLGPSGLTRLMRDVRMVESSMGDGQKRVYERELPMRAKLRRIRSAE